MKIKSRFSGTILFESTNKTIKSTLQSAVQAGADLRGAYLRGAYLRGAYLAGAYLRGAYLRGADLRGAYLRGADLRGADLRGAYLRGVNLRCADLRGAYLMGADLTGANLSDADLRGAYLRGADLDYQICPKGGSFTAWKKAACGCVVQLKIPAWAMRTSSIIGRKCRAEFVVVIAIWDKNQKQIKKCIGWREAEFIYEVGKVVAAGNYDHDPRVECSGGIHFFVTRKEAEGWN